MRFSWMLLLAGARGLRTLPLRPLGACTSSATHRRSAVRADAHDGQLLRVVHAVEAIAPAVRFYQGCFGWSVLDGAEDGERAVIGCADGSMALELRAAAGGVYQAAGGYDGLSVRVPDINATLDSLEAAGGAVLKRAALVEHGPSLEPMEDDEVITTVFEALGTDPSGYPLFLYEDESCEGCTLSGVRLSVYEWKRAREWWQEAAGWSTLRWQSRVPHEASITVTVGPPGMEGPIGPDGPTGTAQPGVVQLTYKYDSRPIKQLGGLEALCIAGAPEEVLEEPNAYPIELVRG